MLNPLTIQEKAERGDDKKGLRPFIASVKRGTASENRNQQKRCLADAAHGNRLTPVHPGVKRAGLLNGITAPLLTFVGANQRFIVGEKPVAGILK